MTHPTDESPVFARSIGPLGKFDVDLKTKLDEDTADLFRRDCALIGSDPSRELRNLIYERIYKKSCDEMVLERFQHDAQRRAVLRGAKGLIEGLEADQGQGAQA